MKPSARNLVASVGRLAGKAATNPMLVLEQEAALARELISVIAGQSELAPAPGDKRFADET